MVGHRVWTKVASPRSALLSNPGRYTVPSGRRKALLLKLAGYLVGASVFTLGAEFVVQAVRQGYCECTVRGVADCGDWR